MTLRPMARLLALTVEEAAGPASGGCAPHRLGGHLLDAATGRFRHCVACTVRLVGAASGGMLGVVEVRRFVGRLEGGTGVCHAAIVARRGCQVKCP